MNPLLVEAIRERRVIEFDYHGHHRVAEPHTYGVMAGREQLLVYQTGGTSSSGRIPDWRTVWVDEIASLRVQRDSSFGARPSWSGQHRHWDAVFTRVE